MSLQSKDIVRLANLARLHVSEAEQVQSLAQLNDILGLIDQLQSQDTAGIEPLAHPLAAIAPVELRLREDAVTEPNNRDNNQKNAPAVQNGLFLVPKVIE